jgi:hypothetical protein
LVAKSPGAGVEGGQEAVVFVGEVLVEGRTRHTCAFDHVLDVRGAIAEFGDGAQHADEQPLALDRPDQVAGQAAGPGGEAAVAVGEEFGGGLDQVSGPLVAKGGDQ